jgi:hypothetical protein
MFYFLVKQTIAIPRLSVKFPTEMFGVTAIDLKIIREAFDRDKMNQRVDIIVIFQSADLKENAELFQQLEQQWLKLIAYYQKQ